MTTPNNPDIATAKLRNSIYEIRLQMWQKGGEFVRSLSQTLGKSDLENQAKLIKAFPEIFEKYDYFASYAKLEQPELNQ